MEQKCTSWYVHIYRLLMQVPLVTGGKLSLLQELLCVMACDMYWHFFKLNSGDTLGEFYIPLHLNMLRNFCIYYLATKKSALVI